MPANPSERASSLSEPAIGEETWPPEGLERVAACPNCSDPRRALLHDGLTDETFFTAPGQWSLYRCGQCACAYLDPRPSPETIGRAYSAYYTHGNAKVVRDGALKAFLRIGVDRFARAYVRGVLLEERLPILDRMFAAIMASLPPLRETIDAKYRHLRRNHERLRLLDVGCGDGTFLRRASELGWHGEGVDFDPAAVEAARAQGFAVRLGSIEAFAEERDAFDVITCNHVIEHLYDPHALLSALFRLLKPGGRLWLETPNVGSEGFRVFGRHWRGLETPRHLLLFNRDALVAAVESAGFRLRGETPWNFKHIRYMFVASRALALEDRARRASIPRWQQLRVLLVEALRPRRREFALLRCDKPVPTSSPASDGRNAQSG